MDPFALDPHVEEVALQPEDAARESLVRDEDVRAHAEDRQRKRGAARLGQDAGERLLGPHAAEIAGRAPDAPGRARRQGRVALDHALRGGEGQIHPSRPASHPIPASTAAAASPPATSSRTTPHPPGRSWSGRIGPGLRMSKKRKRRRAPIQPAASRITEALAGSSGTAAQARSWPEISSITTHPGSFAASARHTGPETATPSSPTPSPDIKSPTAWPTLPVCGAKTRTRSAASASPTIEPAVPGMTGESPEPKPVAIREATGFAAKARRACDIDTGSCRREDPSVLIASCGALRPSL